MGDRLIQWENAPWLWRTGSLAACAWELSGTRTGSKCKRPQHNYCVALESSPARQERFTKPPVHRPFPLRIQSLGLARLLLLRILRTPLSSIPGKSRGDLWGQRLSLVSTSRLGSPTNGSIIEPSLQLYEYRIICTRCTTAVHQLCTGR